MKKNNNIKDKNLDLNLLFSEYNDRIEEKQNLRKYLHVWQKTKGLYALNNKDGGLKGTDGFTKKNMWAYKLKKGAFFLCFRGMLKYDDKDIFANSEIALLRVYDNYNNFIVFDKLDLNETGLSIPYKESYNKHDIMIRPKYMIDDRGAVCSAVDPIILKIPSFAELEEQYKKQRKK